MDTSKLKNFAPASRTRLIEQIGVKLDYVLTARTPDLVEAESLVRSLKKSVERQAREAVIEEVAYVWFNRFAALRYLDAREWHPFRGRVITSVNQEAVLPDLFQQVRGGSIPEELTDYLPGKRVADLLDGRLPSDNPQGEVQRLIIIGVCNYYADILPHLFTRLDDFTTLLLPDDVLTEQSIPHGFRSEISDEDCSQVEVLGWLYQFYISEKKDEVMARKKAVPSEDIPAVTQLFTPHWIVRYLVENSLGRLWLRSRPDSKLKEHMPYYVEDPDVSSEASAKGEGQTPADSLTVATPEEIKLLDPACGSAHMLTYAFDLLVKIYEEEGYAPSEIPEKILTHNLFGLEICPRAAQLAQFALLCKAREYSRKAFSNPVQPQIMCLQNVVLTPEDMQAWSAATGVQLSQDELAQIHQFREHTETFGALIQPMLDVPALGALCQKIQHSESTIQNSDLLVGLTHRKLRLVLDQAEMLSQRYQVVVANPPYMGGKTMNSDVKSFLTRRFEPFRGDTFAAFVFRGAHLCQIHGYLGFMTPNVWMFISSHESLRSHLLDDQVITTLVELPLSAFTGATVQICAFATENTKARDYKGGYIRLCDFKGSENMGPRTLDAIADPNCSWFHRASATNFKKIPGSPIAYWMSDRFVDSFVEFPSLSSKLTAKQGLATGNNAYFVRSWHEVSSGEIFYQYVSLDDSRRNLARWVPYSKGGEFRRWYGCNEFVVRWEEGGREVREYKDENGKELSRFRAADFYFKEALTWGLITSGQFSARFRDPGFVFDIASMSAFSDNDVFYLALINSSYASKVLGLLNPTLNYQIGDIKRIPLQASADDERVGVIVESLIEVARADWDNFETSWDFRGLPLLRSGDWEVESGQSCGSWKGRTLAESWDHYATYCNAAIRCMQELETENNRLWIDAYGLQDELDPEVPEKEITLARADAKKDMAAFLSYAIGCMMGRYSLDHPGLILANAGDTLEQHFEKVGKSADDVTFLPDDDGIIPITEDDWFEDDAASRVREFLKATFDPATVDENVSFIEEALGKKLRKYFTAGAGGFYADYLKTYKKRPIYWMFESPKKHFRALVYLHRYTRDTVNTLLDGYLREFINKLTSSIDQLEHATDRAAADDKRLDKLKVMLRDAQDYEREIILPLAQARIDLDLDDGVKANCPKFGKALAKVPGLS